MCMMVGKKEAKEGFVFLPESSTVKNDENLGLDESWKNVLDSVCLFVLVISCYEYSITFGHFGSSSNTWLSCSLYKPLPIFEILSFFKLPKTTITLYILAAR